MKKNLLRSAGALLLIAMFSLAHSTAASADRAPGPAIIQPTPVVYDPSIIYVTTDWNIRHYWWPGISNSVPMVDYYTKSHMRWGNCVAGFRCFHIREVQHGNNVGQTFFINSYHTFIDVNPHYRYHGYFFHRVLFSHELGHASRILNHSQVCNTVMIYQIPCPNGLLPPWRFTWQEQQILTQW